MLCLKVPARNVGQSLAYLRVFWIRVFERQWWSDGLYEALSVCSYWNTSWLASFWVVKKVGPFILSCNFFFLRIAL